ncbi:alpha/beta fold hydrolase [Chitinimonas sp. BJYL2]|uniref:alpha/beta fold hydrolase n=1 Tax=Chitinimonas sp. BJYL2 TaxID=2976696 RepID=UPI0022B3689C|nr:alpha/beta fold hydrolase [Chitinimonas sp. BJYL2]
MNPWLVVGLAGVVLVGIGLTWRHWATLTITLLRKRAGYVRHTIGVDGFELVYHEAGRRDAPPMVLLHGFAGDGDNWVLMTPHLGKDFRILIPDLPGFGETGYLPGQSYSLDRQVARLKDFFDMLHLEQVHLCGNSLGGYFAAAFAAAYPQRIASLALFNAAGVDMPKRSPFYEAAMAGENWLLVRNEADFDRVLKLVYHRPPWLPGFLRDYQIDQRVLASDDQDAVFHEIFTERVWLDQRMPQISAPTLILWGDDDRVLDISSIKLFQAGIANAQAAIIPACGHVPMMEKPEATARVYLRFLAGLTQTAPALDSLQAAEAVSGH